MAELSPNPKFKAFVNGTSTPLVGGKLYTYTAGTTSPLATVKDFAGTPNTNPIILDANGECDLWLDENSYKFELRDADEVTMWTVDNVSSIAYLIAVAVAVQPATVTANYSTLLALSPDDYPAGRVVTVTDDGISGQHKVVASALASPDGGTTQSNATWFVAGKHFARIYDGPKSVSWFSGSLDAAVAACAEGDPLVIPVGACGPLSAPLTKGIKLIGEKKPVVKADLTGLEEGSIIRGPLIYDADNCEFYDLGVDSGSAVCTAYHSGVEQEGLICTVTYATSDHYNLRVRNVVCMTKSASAAVHSFAAERQINANIDGVETVFGTHGQAYKVIRSNVSNLIAKRAGSNGVIIKRDESAACYDSNFNNIAVDCFNGGARGSYGITLDSHRGDDGATPGNLYGINISNFTVSGAQNHGLFIYGAGTSTDIVTDVNVTNGVITDCLLDGFSTFGNTGRVTLVNVQAKACGRFGFSDGQDGVSSRSTNTKMIGCFAGNCLSGFVGRGLRFYTMGCEASGNSNWGFYAKSSSSSYRTANRGASNTTALYGNDSATYWFELDMPYQALIFSPTFQNSWVNYDATQATWKGARYWIGSDGMVHLSGVIKDGTLNTAAFTLPDGYRPPTYVRFNANGLGVLVDLFIDSGGAVTPVAGTNTFVALDGISFLPNRAD